LIHDARTHEHKRLGHSEQTAVNTAIVTPYGFKRHPQGMDNVFTSTVQIILYFEGEMTEKVTCKIRKLPNIFSRSYIRAARKITLTEEERKVNVLKIRQTGNRALE